ncbi:MAG TPA: phosphatase PAP2 family protein [Mycobacteriales bacterium]|nr:phosphatase PAP2 family protein [Mycobacteriales bacterium]
MFGSIDRDLFTDAQDLAAHTGWAHGFFVDYAKYGLGLFALMLLAAWWRARSGPRPSRLVAVVLWAGLAALVVLALNQVVVHLVDRQRPFVALPNVHPLLAHSRDPGFPSDHAVAVGAMAAGLWRYARRFGVVAAVLAVLMCFARVYDGVHWPADVTVGVLFGAVVGWFGWRPAAYLLVPVCAWVARGPLGGLVRDRRVSVSSAPTPLAGR